MRGLFDGTKLDPAAMFLADLAVVTAILTNISLHAEKLSLGALPV